MRYIAIMSVLCLLLSCASVHGADTLLIYAGAASKPPTEEAAELYEKKTGVKIDLVIGDRVAAGQKVASIGGIILHAPIDGILRGLTHDDVPVEPKTKVIEVDPRGEPEKIAGIAERPKRIALGVLEAIKQGANS